MTDRLGHPAYYTRDAERNLVAATSPGGAITFLGHDGDGKLTSLTDPDGNAPCWDYNANGQPLPDYSYLPGVSGSTTAM